jgi:hypothetical protein
VDPKVGGTIAAARQAALSEFKLEHAAISRRHGGIGSAEAEVGWAESRLRIGEGPTRRRNVTRRCAIVVEYLVGKAIQLRVAAEFLVAVTTEIAITLFESG